MTNEVGLFSGNPLVNSDLFKSLQSINENLGGNTFGTTRRISVRGSKFRQMINGEQTKVSKDDTMNIVIVDAATVSRTYYAGEYDKDVAVPPTCWSADTEAPESDVPEDQKQASRCANCSMNIKGSGQGNTRACRYNQRLAVAIEGDLDTIYQLQLAATSIFGDAKENEMPMQSYARFLQAHNTPAIAVLTEMRFDEDADMPKLFFRPLRALDEKELNTVVALRDHEDTKNAVTYKVFETDKVEHQPAAEEKPKTNGKGKKKKVEAKTEEVEEPTKVEKADTPEPDKDDLASIVADWDD